MKSTNLKLLGYASVAGIVAALTAPAYAAQDTIDQRLENFRMTGIADVPPEEYLLTGRDDLMLLQERKFFTLSATGRTTFTNNAYLSDQVRKSDTVVDGKVSGKVATKIAQTYDVYAELGAIGSRYMHQQALGYNGITANVGGEAPINDKWRVGVQYGYTMAFLKGGFSEQLVTINDFVAYTNYTLQINPNTLLVPQLSLDRTIAAPSDYNALALDASVSLLHRFRPTVIGVVAVETGYKDYNNYFESITHIDRKDRTYGVNASVRWTPLDAVQLSASFAATHNDSTLLSSDYNAVSISPMVEMKVNF